MSIQNKNLPRVVALLAGLALTGAAHAQPILFTFNDTVAASAIAGVNVGDAIKVTLTLDNGHTGLVSQTWTNIDLQSVSFDFGNGALVTTFLAPFGGNNLTFIDGRFATDANGQLVEALQQWADIFSIGSDFTTNGAAPSSWRLGLFTVAQPDSGVLYAATGGRGRIIRGAATTADIGSVDGSTRSLLLPSPNPPRSRSWGWGWPVFSPCAAALDPRRRLAEAA